MYARAKSRLLSVSVRVSGRIIGPGVPKKNVCVCVGGWRRKKRAETKPERADGYCRCSSVRSAGDRTAITGAGIRATGG